MELLLYQEDRRKKGVFRKESAEKETYILFQKQGSVGSKQITSVISK